MTAPGSMREDPHGLQLCGHGPLAIYVVAKASYIQLRRKAIGVNEVQARLMHLVARGPFRSKKHMRIAFKLINPYGHGANRERFQNATLRWFRQEFPEDDVLTDGLALFICACRWWIEQQGLRTVSPELRAIGSSDFDEKLAEFGFLAGERETLLRVLRCSS